MSNTLRLVPGLGEPAAEPPVRFCSHCGLPPLEAFEQPATRVCQRCNLGLLLEAAASVAPRGAEPFLVIDARLNVCALSRAAEELLAVEETDAVNHHVTEFLVPAATEAPRPENLLAQIVLTASGEDGARTVVVRPAGVFGVRLWARVGRCGPSPSALLVLGV